MSELELRVAELEWLCRKRGLYVPELPSLPADAENPRGERERHAKEAREVDTFFPKSGGDLAFRKRKRMMILLFGEWQRLRQRGNSAVVKKKMKATLEKELFRYVPGSPFCFSLSTPSVH